MRKRGVLRALGEDVSEARARADAATVRRLRLVNAVSATAFVLGGSLFAIGAALAQGDVGAPLLPASVYLAGGVFFSTGGYTALLQVINAPRQRPGVASRPSPGAGGRCNGGGWSGSAALCFSPAPWSSRSTWSTRSSPT